MIVRKLLSLKSGLQLGFSSRTHRTFLVSSVYNLKTNKCKMGCSTSKVQKQKEDEKSACEDEYVEGVVCKVSDVEENNMKAFDLADSGKVLVIKQNGNISAIGSKCTHYGAPLENGALGKGRVRCQWHGACFNIKNGDIEDFPGLDSLPCYDVKIEDGLVKVRAKRNDLKTNKRLKPMSNLDKNNKEHIVVVGGGPSGATCVETLRQEGFTGQITLVAKEKFLPYDRVKVSKAMDSEYEKVRLRTDEFYKQFGINVRKDTEVVGVDTKQNTVQLSDGQSLSYNKLYIATGARALKAAIPGKDLKNVYVLRDLDHGHAVHALLSPEKEMVVLGASFVALEAAAYSSNKIKKVTVVGRDNVPFKKLFGEEVGRAVMNFFQEKGVHFIMNSGMKELHGNDDNEVTEAVLVTGETLKADIVVMGTGSELNTEFLRNSEVNLLKTGAIEVNEYLQTNVENVYAGGDIAHAPIFVERTEKSTIGHYPLAHYHGKIAALNMLNKSRAVESVPYFWTTLYGKSFRYSGHGDYDDVVYSGNVSELKFVAFYLKNNRVVGVSSCGADPYVSVYAELRAAGKQLYKDDLGDDNLGWAKTKIN